MDFINSLFVEHSALQAIIILSLISAAGIMLGKIKIFGVSLGITFVFFIGILAGNWGLSIDKQMLFYAETFGLVLFVYALGLQVGPGFFSSMRSDGMKLLVPSLALLAIGTVLAIALSYASGVKMSDMTGILCGATTNTPALAAAQQTLKQIGSDSNGAALGCALTYPLGVVGVILALVVLRKFFVRPADLPGPDNKHKKNVFIASYKVTNPGIFGKTIAEIASINPHNHFVISRMWHNGHVLIPMSNRVLGKDDILLVITKPEESGALQLIFGEQEQKDWNSEGIDWNKIDSELTSQRILVTRPEINGKKLSSLRLRNNYGINISRVYRAEVQLLATPDLVLQLGDRLTVVGETADIKPGNALPLTNIPVGTVVHNVELYPGRGGQLARAAGNSAQLMAKEGAYAQVRLPSGEVRMVSVNCKATIGEVGNQDHENISIGKAGRKRHMGWRPTVRGVVMNPNDHPHGGGEGKSPIGRPAPVTPWGKPALGLKTRKKKNKTDKFIVKRRNAK